MKQILCSDWLPKHVRWAYLACLGFPVSCRLKSQLFSIGQIIGHLHDDVILLLRPESFRGFAFLCKYLNLAGMTKFKYERNKEKDSALKADKDQLSMELQIGTIVL